MNVRLLSQDSINTFEKHEGKYNYKSSKQQFTHKIDYRSLTVINICFQLNYRFLKK